MMVRIPITKGSKISDPLYNIYMEPVCPLFLGLNPEKEGLFRSKQGSFEPCFFLLCGGYTLAWRLRGRLRRATVCVNVGYARLRGIHLPTRNASARNRARTFFIYLRNSWSWRRRTWRTGAWRRGVSSKALCLAYKQKRELLNLDYGPADGQGPVGRLCWLRECLRGGYAEATRRRELESEIRKGQEWKQSRSRPLKTLPYIKAIQSLRWLREMPTRKHIYTRI